MSPNPPAHELYLSYLTLSRECPWWSDNVNVQAALLMQDWLAIECGKFPERTTFGTHEIIRAQAMCLRLCLNGGAK